MMRRLSSFVSVPLRRATVPMLAFVLVLAAVLAAAAPAARAANPPEGSFWWSPAYVPSDGPHAFRAMAAGANFLLYTAGDDWSGQWVVKGVDCGADTEGSTEWTDTRSGADGSSVSFLATDKAKNLYAVGTDTTTAGDIHLVKYSPDGTVVWQKSWDGPARLDDTPKAVAVTAAGTVYVAGTAGKPTGFDDAVLLKYDAGGKLKYRYILATSLYDAFESVSFDAKGNAYVTGQRNANVGVSTLTTVKVNPSGRRVWQRQIAGLGVAYDGMFVKVKGTSVFVGGSLYKWQTWALAARYTTGGKRLWARADLGPVESVEKITLDASGRMVFVGTADTVAGATSLTTAWVGMLPADGSATMWEGTLFNDMGATGYRVYFHDVALDAGGNLYLAGEWWTDVNGTEGNALVARIPAPVVGGGPMQAEKIWRWDGPASGLDQFRGMLVQPGNGVFACGTEHAGDLEWRGVVQRLEQ
jgi:hypothetical protein